MNTKISIGVSSCLMGNAVRHDGSHKRNRFITDTLSEYFDYIPFCPETAMGLSTPRPAIRLLSVEGKVHLVDSKDESIDHTKAMIDVSQKQLQHLSGLSGYILKSKSPSCGMERVNLYNESGMPQKDGVGLFAAQLIKKYPHMPVEEEGRLHDARLCENFIERVFAYHRWQQIQSNDLTAGQLIKFHQAHKFILMAHNPSDFRSLGKLAANACKKNVPIIAEQYIAKFMQALKTKATRKTHLNVLEHCMGYLKRDIDSQDKSILRDTFKKYATGHVPLVVPITLLKYHFLKNPQNYINSQFYMNPYPDELKLRNNL